MLHLGLCCFGLSALAVCWGAAIYNTRLYDQDNCNSQREPGFERLMGRSAHRAQTCIPLSVCALRAVDANARQPPKPGRDDFCN